MRMSIRFSLIAAVPLALAACADVPSLAVPPPAPVTAPPAAHALAQAACAGCHSVERHGLSPNPASPEFPAIANRAGLDRATLTAWLREAHNYPEEMDFHLEDDEVAQLVDYILTLRDAGYHPPI